MESNKIAVVFPGIGYHADKPLLYYAKRLAREQGYDVLEITYDFSFKAKEIKGDQDKMKDAFEIAVKQAGEQLAAVEFDKCEKVLFIGKSIGTAVAAHYDKTHGIGAKHIVLTPVPQTFDFLTAGCGVVYHGNADPWCDTGIAVDKCKELELKLHIVEGANHSLETKSAVADVQKMEEIVRSLAGYISE